jgi:hypothetical protein
MVLQNHQTIKMEYIHLLIFKSISGSTGILFDENILSLRLSLNNYLGKFIRQT